MSRGSFIIFAASHLVVTLILSVSLPSKIPLIVSFGWTALPRRRRIRLYNGRFFLRLQEKAKEETENWREFRAKLVQQYRDRSSSGGDGGPATTSSSASWAYEAGTLIEKGSIVLSRVESTLGCHDLRQPYFHKCAVLVLEHDKDSTRGIILNRPSNLVCTDSDILLLEEDVVVDDKFVIDPDFGNSGSMTTPNPKNAWSMNFGGDILGLFSEEPMIVVLHSLADSALARECSEEVLPNLWVTSHAGARSLVAQGEATCDDFHSFYGFSLWEQGMLQREVDRGSWYIVSMDSQSVLNSLRLSRQDVDTSLKEGGIKWWEDWTGRIHKEKEENVEASRDAFSDLMLKEWCNEMLCLPAGEEEGRSDTDYTFNMFEATVGPGSLVQASSDPTTYMLFDQLFHKSTVLVLKEEEDFSLGLILNLPTVEAYEHELPNGATVCIPIRYGGPLGHHDDNDDERNTMDGVANRIIWLHNNEKLRDMKVGQSISATSSFWTCSQIQALNAIDMGLAKASDFLAIQGHVLWEKEMGVGGIAGQIVSGDLREVNVDRLDDIWTILGNQSALESLDDVNLTFATTREAWDLGQAETLAEESEGETDEPRCVYGTAVTLPEFADEALRKWIEIFLWDNREYIPFF